MTETNKEEPDKASKGSQKPPEAPQGVKDDKTMEVPVSLLKALQDDVAAIKEENRMLTQIADEKRRAAWITRNQKKLPAIIQLRTFMHEGKDKVILGWKSLVNDVYKDPTTQKWIERQTVKIIFEDGKDQEMPYMTWVRGYQKVKARLISSRTDEQTGNVAVILQREDNGKKYEIDIMYVN